MKCGSFGRLEGGSEGVVQGSFKFVEYLFVINFEMDLGVRPVNLCVLGSVIRSRVESGKVTSVAYLWGHIFAKVWEVYSESIRGHIG